MPHFQLAILLGMTVALGPLALDAYLPAFPSIAGTLGIAHGQVGLTLSAYVASLGLAQLVGGPLSDRYGRRLILMAGLTVFAGASLMVSQCQSLHEMMGWRLIQGIGGAFCAVSVPAIVRDQTSGQDAARLFGMIGLVMFIAPALAPSMGSLMLAIADWPAIFWTLSGYAVLLALVLNLALFRRLPVRAPVRTPLSTLVTNYSLVLRHPVTMRFIGLQSLCFSAMLVFITNASYIYQDWFELSRSAFSALFAANIALMATLNLLNRWLLQRFESVTILRAVVAVQALAISALVLVSWAGLPVWAVAACIIASVGCMGAIVPNSMANALEFFPHLSGTAAAMLGATQFTVAGLISALSTVIFGESLLAIVGTMAACVFLALSLALGAPAAVQKAVAAR
ncbi:multidrug effflux MFS transporter [Marinobacter sp. C2H3]|uniref:multidrug effflux MFS transporter n=1 Tax=Marinobacter sp. C2H3 TaxID=3119003 RepID=UPI00300EFDE9